MGIGVAVRTPDYSRSPDGVVIIGHSESGSGD
jgi:hypothetical protein